ncbi:MAG TPA: RebB family R body protein [Thermoanaerobaculia bacterium]|nr:RebB family R body protein [Thermoanaerobaculia bacterium]
MANPDPPVNPQITDAVTQTNVKVVADGPAVATNNLYQATANALSLAAQNATAIQQNGATVLQAATVMGVTTLYGIDTASTADGITEILEAVQ